MFPFLVNAYGIENFYINAVVLDDGDLLVEEYFEVNGEYNGYERIINYRNDSLFEFNQDLEWYGPSNISNGSSVELIDVMAVDYDDDFDFDNVKGKRFKEVSYADVGEYGVYTVTNNSDIISFYFVIKYL